MKSLLVWVALFAVAVSAPASLIHLPDSEMEEYSGYSTFDENGVSGRVDFAVYDTTQQDLSELEGMEGYNGEQYVYAYQVFSSSIEAITSFVLTGFDPDAFAEDNMNTSETLGGNDSNGHDADAWEKYTDEAVWFFDGGVMVAYERSYFLLIFSNYSPIVGDYEVNSSGSDPYVPGDSGEDPVPEPATLVLLAGGVLLSLYRRK
jgi:hypothetical protein